MLALTAKAAKRFRVRFAEIAPVASGAWVVDQLKLGRGAVQER